MKDITIKIENSFGQLVKQTERITLNRLQRRLTASGYDVTADQYLVLLQLWHQDGQTQKDLARKTGKDKTSITRLINGLESKSLVVRVPNQIDARSKMIFLTAKGKTNKNSIVRLAQDMFKEALKDISIEELEICKGVLKKVIQNLR